MPTTIRRINALSESKAVLEITNDKGQTATGTFYRDGSGDVTEGRKWMRDELGRQYGKRPVTSAIQQAIRDGEATL